MKIIRKTIFILFLVNLIMLSSLTASRCIFLLIFSGKWKEENFKKYNFDALGIPPSGGHLHPLMKIREELRQIFLEMG